MGLVRRLKAATDSRQLETRALLQQVLGGTGRPRRAPPRCTRRPRACPFIVEEMAHAYRDGGMIQQIDGVWTLARQRRAPGARPPSGR